MVSQHITISVTFHGGSSKDKIKSKKHAVMIHQRKDIVIKSDTIRLISVFMFQQADIVWTTIKDVHQTSSYERQWKVNITTDGPATIVAAHEVD